MKTNLYTSFIYPCEVTLMLNCALSLRGNSSQINQPRHVWRERGYQVRCPDSLARTVRPRTFWPRFSAKGDSLTSVKSLVLN